MHIGIVGCIGVGKSRLTSALAEHLGYRAYFEPVKENPYLDDFYRQPTRFATIMQFFMLTARFRQHLAIQDLRQRGLGIVQDQIIYGDVLYGQLTHEFGYMDDRDYTTYREHFRTLEPLLKLPDVIIELRVDLPTIQQRISERGRNSEKSISAEYLKRLSEIFSEWVASVENKTKVVRLDWNAYQPIEQVVKNLEQQLDVQLRLPT